MDSPPLRLILIVWRTLVEYLGWVLQHSSSARCEACQRCIFHTSWAQASHLDYTRVNCIDQSIPEPLLHRPVVHGSSSLLSPCPRTLSAGLIGLSRCYVSIWKPSFSNVPTKLPGLISSAGYVQSPGSVSFTSVILIFSSAPTTNFVQLFGYVSRSRLPDH